MSQAYVIRNQDGQYWSRRDDWVSGRDASVVFFKLHYDEALNHLFEVSTKDINLRGKVVQIALSELKRPILQDYGPEPVAPESYQGTEPRGHTSQVETA